MPRRARYAGTEADFRKVGDAARGSILILRSEIMDSLEKLQCLMHYMQQHGLLFL